VYLLFIDKSEKMAGKVNLGLQVPELRVAGKKKLRNQG
jgi:hypothetical protein